MGFPTEQDIVIPSKIRTISVVRCEDLPEEVIMWLTEQEVSTHYNNDITCVENDNNPFAIWLKENGYEFKEGNNWIALFAT